MNAREDAEWVGDTITQLKAEVERLRERCLAYKGQVEAGSIAIQHLQGEIARMREALGDLISDAERQMANPSHHMPFSLPKAKAALSSGQPQAGGG